MSIEFYCVSVIIYCVGLVMTFIHLISSKTEIEHCDSLEEYFWERIIILGAPLIWPIYLFIKVTIEASHALNEWKQKLIDLKRRESYNRK